MSKRLDETIGAVGFDNLINGQDPPAEGLRWPRRFSL